MSAREPSEYVLWKVDDELQCRVKPVGATQSRHRGGDAGVEVVLLVEAERLEQSFLRPEVPVQRGARHLGFRGDIGQLQLPAAIAGEDDERGRKDPPSHRLLSVGGRARSHVRVLYIYAVQMSH